MENTENKYPRGSEWRKWDLHIHTPKSIYNKYGGDNEQVWEKFIEALERLPHDVKVIGINDYYFIDGYEKVMTYKAQGRLNNIDKIFPILEFRIDTFGSGSENKLQKINLHILFDIDEQDIDNEIKKIREEFINLIPITSLEKHQTKKLSIDNFIAEGGTLQAGFSSLIPPTKKVFELASSSTWKDRVFIFLGYKEWSNLDKNQQLKPFKEDLYSKAGAFFSSNYDTIERSQEWLNEYGSRRLLHSLDIHDFNTLDTANKDENGEFLERKNYICNTWIKADPTFEGLKQILYEPSERVKIQNDNPGLEREKSPFTLITIPQKTKVFKDEDDVFFDANNIPLNNGLVSIIGGRGTGKSQLINYLAAIFGKIKQANNYNLDSDIEISRQVSLTEEAKVFCPNDSPNASFMFIEQSQIKNLVADRDKFSKNILETIGVTDTYEISKEYSEEADLLVNEYHRIIKVLFPEGKTIEERKSIIQKEIKRYEDFIQNITSEQNKKKLEDYKGRVELLHRNKNWQQQVTQQLDKQKRFVTESNAILQSWNEQLNSRGIQIPLIDISETQNYLEQTLLPNILESEKAINERINLTKNEFKDYKGDLSTLLSRVSSFQEKLNSLKTEKTSIEKEEQNYIRLSSESFKNIGAKIRDSIQEYTSLIGEKWKEFKGENLEDNSDKKRLLNLILQNGLEVEAAISFDVNKMYELLLDKLDKRKYSIDKLQDILKIKNLGDFFSFVNLDSDVNVFLSDEIKEDLRNEVLYHCYKRYTDFISIGVNVTLDKKSITKLSYGQQGTIYLRLQIAANMFSDTIIYDQPEDDLDNDFITKELVTIFKTIKLYRQVIIVSHNANLVVNADSEQIIVAENKDGVLSYMSGSLENPQINAKVCQILEGGKEAFDRRKRKYRTGI